MSSLGDHNKNDKQIRQGRPAKRLRDHLDKTLERHDKAEHGTIQANPGDGMLRPSPNHGTPGLPNDDDDDDDDDDECNNLIYKHIVTNI